MRRWSTPSTTTTARTTRGCKPSIGAAAPNSSPSASASARSSRSWPRRASSGTGSIRRAIALAAATAATAPFSGRFARDKGPHVAIDAARAAGVAIRLGGAPHRGDHEYFERELRPRLLRPGVTAVGEVGGRDKRDLLADACALLFPVDWEEPFGLVMIEAMLSGTPVLAFDRGSAREIVDEGVTGFVCRDAVELAARLRRHRSVRSRGVPAARARALDGGADGARLPGGVRGAARVGGRCPSCRDCRLRSPARRAARWSCRCRARPSRSSWPAATPSA